MTPERIKAKILEYCIKEQSFNSFDIAKHFRFSRPAPGTTIVNFVCRGSNLFDEIGPESEITGAQNFKLKKEFECT